MLNTQTATLSLQNLSETDFGELVETHRRELQVHCYRMMGSLQDAEDMVQETFLRAWVRCETYQARSTIRAWLYRIATNVCIDTLRRRPRRHLPQSREAESTLEQPIPASVNKPIWLEPYPDNLLPASESSNPEAVYTLNENIQLAFMMSLHLLSPRQRATLLLRDVLDWQADEVAEALGLTVSSVKSALHRARTTMGKYHESLVHERDTPSHSDVNVKAKLDLYLHAWHTLDTDKLTSLLREDASFSMPPVPSWYRGRDTIGKLIRQTIFSGSIHWYLVPTRANGQPAFGVYRLNETTGSCEAYAIQVVTFAGQTLLTSPPSEIQTC